MPIENLPKGALPDPEDKRDFLTTDQMMGAVNVDWSKEFRLPEPPQEDQGSSDSCVAQSASYYHWQLHGKNFSRRDLFCRIALQYGAYLRDGVKEIVNNGQATRDEVADPSYQTPQNMRDASGTKPEYRSDDKELNYFVLPQQDINGVAWGVQNYKGVIFGLNGTNTGWQDLKNPQPPLNGEPNVWGHALYAMGFHMHSGQKCIIAKSSWKEVNEHHIKENYFLTGNTFNSWVLIPQQSLTTTTMQLVNDKGTVYVITGNKDKRKIGIADLTSLGLFGDEPQTQMDTSSIPEYNIIKDGTTITNK